LRYGVDRSAPENQHPETCHWKPRALANQLCVRIESEGDMKARDFVAQPVKLSYDAKWEEASPAHGQIGNRCDH
jgi:hypothetical protein